MESEAAIVRVAGMEAVMVDGNDPKKLLEAILSTHLTKGAKSLVGNQSHARKHYDSLAVGVGEGLTAFKGRFYAAIRAMIVVGEAPPDQARQTVDFLGKLQMSTQYREPVVWLKNSQTDMNTVEEAVFEVGEYVSPMWQNRPRPGTTFAAGGARESDSDTEDAKAAKPDRAFKGKCYGCGQFGHMFANCDVAAPAAGRRAHPEEETIALLKEQVASLMAERDAPVRAHRKYKKKTGAALLGGLSVLDDESTSENDEVSDSKSASYFQMRPDFIYTNRDNTLDSANTRRAAACPAILTTVGEREAQFTPRQVAAAKEALELVRKLGYPSIRAVRQGMISGAIKNCDVTVRDIDRSIALWGPALPALKGRTTGHKTPAVPEAPLTMPFRDAQMCCDIMAVDRNLFLISVVKPFQFFMATPIRNQSAEDIHAALTKQLKTLRGHQVIVRMIHSDRESGVKAVVDWMHENGILPELIGAGEAVQAAERGIRLVKERARAVISGLPFVLPRLLGPALVEYCVQRIHGLQSSVSSGALSGRSPKEEMTGRVLDAQRDLALGFGDYVEVHAAHVDNSMAERTVGCIALHPTENLSGAWNFLNLNTVAMTVRQSWTSLPTPDFVLDRLNELAATRGQVEVGIEGNASVSLDEQQQGLPAEGAGEEGELEEQSENELPDMLEGDWEESMEDGARRDLEHAMMSSKASVTPDGKVAVGVAEQRDVPSVTNLPVVMERRDVEQETLQSATLEPKHAL
ncbi:hypothetical protein FVE85_7694 [Porphyridium purpureum]|uniref:CCHC-type domain-containing protein n=1 Tax=Porphyridium purpureum TaxID=35688 RepID=A0A5J4YKY0_PORPP|nr:hypothetical protein FVE85_7694 [Porphyridium purpureum]|eukprot:POR7713..scf210_14